MPLWDSQLGGREALAACLAAGATREASSLGADGRSGRGCAFSVAKAALGRKDGSCPQAPPDCAAAKHVCIGTWVIQVGHHVLFFMLFVGDKSFAQFD